MAYQNNRERPIERKIKYKNVYKESNNYYKCDAKIMVF